MRSSIITIFILCSGLYSHAQQVPQYTQWSFHQFANNPSHAGIKPCIDIHTLYRKQWWGFDGAPQGGFLSVSLPIDSRRNKFLSARYGTGFKFETDQIGNFSFNRLNFAYAAHFNFDPINRLSLGLYAGGVQMSYDPASATTVDPDPSVMNQANFLAPDASFGAWFNSEHYYFGLMLKNLIPWRWKDIGDESKYRIHIAANAGYQFTMGEKMSLLPSLMVRIPPKGPVSADLNLFADYKNIIGLGIGYRNTDAFLVLLNIKIKGQFSIAYSFDYTLSTIQSASSNTHEISLRFTSCKPDRSTPTGCPLFE